MSSVLAGSDSSFKNFLQNFGDESQFWRFWWFWYRLQNFEKSLVTRVRPYWDKFWKILTFAFWWNGKVMINHRGGILIFCRILSKLKILKSLTLAQGFQNFGSLTLRTPNFRFWSNFGYLLNSILPNLDQISISSFSKTPKLFKFDQKLVQIFVVQYSQICVLGF